MIKPNHISYLRLADSVLTNLDLPYKSYTLTYQELFQRVNSDVEYETIYLNQFEKFLTSGYDSKIEIESKSVLFNSVLLFLSNEGLILYSKSQIQITYKGVLKILKGFEKEYKEEKQNIENDKKEKKFEHALKIFDRVLAVVSFIAGILITSILKSCS